MDEQMQEQGQLDGDDDFAQDAGVVSIIDQLAQTRQEIKENAEPLDLAIPGYKELLWARFRPYAVAKAEKKVPQFQRAVKKKQPIVLNSACDTLSDALEQLMVKKDDGELIPIDGELPVGFDQRLGEMLKIPGVESMTTTRQIIIGVFPTEQSVLAMANKVNEWLQGELDEETNESFLGESGVTRP